MVGVPGLALPDSALATAMLPSVPDMVDASIANSHLARKVARAPSPEAPSKAAPGSEPFPWRHYKASPSHNCSGGTTPNILKACSSLKFCAAYS